MLAESLLLVRDDPYFLILLFPDQRVVSPPWCSEFSFASSDKADAPTAVSIVKYGKVVQCSDKLPTNLRK